MLRPGKNGGHETFIYQNILDLVHSAEKDCHLCSLIFSVIQLHHDRGYKFREGFERASPVQARYMSASPTVSDDL